MITLHLLYLILIRLLVIVVPRRALRLLLLVLAVLIARNTAVFLGGSGVDLLYLILIALVLHVDLLVQVRRVR